MKKESFWYTTKDQHEIHVKCWHSPTPPKAIVQIAHGMVEHIERYDAFATYLTEQGITVYGHDHRGHGKTGEKNNTQGFFAEKNGFDRVVYDCIELTEMIRENNKQLPIFLVGHSMGSFISRRYIMLTPQYLTGVILIGTSFQPNSLLNVAKQAAKVTTMFRGKNKEAKLMNKLTFLGYNKHTDKQTDFDWLCSVHKEVEQYEEDKLCGFIPTNQFFYDLYTGIQLIQSKEKNKLIPTGLPLLFLSGKDDPVGQYGQGVEKCVDFYQTLGVKNIDLHLYEEKRHEILNETNKIDIFHEIVTWINRQMTCHNLTQSL
ncbi:alpha/beta hydrolase [Gracilibacillus sp. S3-1-1]|uniref:Alpha/beta hydrolase n=1 Tax=Gracilibacillus pellucidus TaxID=3095368 RepID=A0ACC6M168_9BACI|nr:alpha/beta hydrolase [Gracilibacillus sp. S3-1-1]MDX8044684.1 alpha/beta hydrolase [Gracilibacillus sp. S3-1-1]